MKNNPGPLSDIVVVIAIRRCGEAISDSGFRILDSRYQFYDFRLSASTGSV